MYSRAIKNNPIIAKRMRKSLCILNTRVETTTVIPHIRDHLPTFVII